MKDGLLNTLQGALNDWSEKLAEVWQLLTTSPQAFKGGQLWGVIVNINTAMQGIAFGLLVVFFLAGLLRHTTSFQDLRRPETALRFFLRFAIAKGLVTYCMELLLAVMEISQGIVQRVIFAGGGSISMSATVPNEIATAVESVNLLASFPMFAVIAIGRLVADALAFILIMTVYGRFIKLYIFTALAPIPLSTAAGEHLSQTGRQFFKNYISACMEFAVVGLACVLCSKLISTSPVINAEDAPITQVWGYLKEVIFNMLLFVGMVKTCDVVAKQIMGG